MIAHQNQGRSAREGKKRKQQSEHRRGGNDFFSGYSRRIDHADGRNIFGLLDAGHFVLLGEKLIQCLLHPHAADRDPHKELQVAEAGAREDRALLLRCRHRSLSRRQLKLVAEQRCRGAGHLGKLALQTRDASFCFANSHVAIAIDLAQRLQGRTARQ